MDISDVLKKRQNITDVLRTDLLNKIHDYEQKYNIVIQDIKEITDELDRIYEEACYFREQQDEADRELYLEHF